MWDTQSVRIPEPWLELDRKSLLSTYRIVSYRSDPAARPVATIRCRRIIRPWPCRVHRNDWNFYASRRVATGFTTWRWQPPSRGKDSSLLVSMGPTTPLTCIPETESSESQSPTGVSTSQGAGDPDSQGPACCTDKRASITLWRTRRSA